MEKKFMILGLIIILLAVVLSGCNEIGLTNIGDLSANPQNYFGKEVKVKGSVMLIAGIGSITDEQGHSFGIKYNTITTLTGNYYLTGIVEHNSITGYYLDATKAEAV